MDTQKAPEQSQIRSLANAIRALSMDAVQAAKSGHPGMPMGMADVATVLYRHFLKFDAANPAWPDRDRFVLSAGHGSMLLYSLLYLTGTGPITLDNIKRFRQIDSPCAGHPEYGHLPGIETTTGPLGQGVATAVGMAIAERHLSARFGNDLVDHKTYVIASDGDLMEGISHEAISIAGHLKLSKLIVLWDDNQISIDGPISLSDSTDQLLRFKAAGWATDSCDGHDAADIFRALNAAQNSDKPVLIACRTKIGFGSPNKEGTSKAHGEALGEEEIKLTRERLNWPYEAFVVPNELMNEWRQIGSRGKDAYAAWNKAKAANAKSAEFDKIYARQIPANFDPAMLELKKKFAGEKAMASRKASELTLEVINDTLPFTIGGSADLTPSNNTKTKATGDITPSDFSGRYLRYGIREHGMAAAMNGMALHGGVLPYGGTFLIFSDYCKPAIRLSALMGTHVVYVMTHDSIGLGEDGPTHQPIEQLAGLRAVPGLHVFRPADAVETAECWQIAVKDKKRPSLLALSRQNLDPVRTTDLDANRSARGAYELLPATGTAQVTLLATGSEVEIAVKARTVLEAEGIGTRVVSMPCWSLFDEQSPEYQEKVLGPQTVKVGIEAASPLGWDRYIGPAGKFIGMRSFGASAPYKEVYKHFGITAEAVADAARDALKQKG